MKLLEANTEEYELELVEEGNGIVAHWQKEGQKYTLYHDGDGSNDLSWSVNLDGFSSVQNEYLLRRIESRKQAKNISQIFKSPLKPTLWVGRPDLIIEVREKEGALKKLIIGEVKYTNNEGTAKQGIGQIKLSQIIIF